MANHAASIASLSVHSTVEITETDPAGQRSKGEKRFQVFSEETEQRSK